MNERRVEQESRPAGRIEFEAPAPGALTWTPANPEEVPEDRVVREAFRFLSSGAGLAPEAARELGRAMGLRARGGDLPVYLDAFSHLGLGRLTLASVDADRYVVHGHDLAGAERAPSTTCALALGFVEGAVGAIAGLDASLGAEMHCRSRGHATCSFFVRGRR